MTFEESENETRALLQKFENIKRERDAIRAVHQYPENIPVIKNGTYTPEIGNAIVTEIFHANGYTKATLIGSLSSGNTSKHDIDILLPLRNKSTKQRAIKTLYNLFMPKRMHTLQFDRVLFETEPYGNVEIFFNDKDKFCK